MIVGVVGLAYVSRPWVKDIRTYRGDRLRVPASRSAVVSSNESTGLKPEH